MPVFTDALIGDTTHLSAEEFGCYFLLLCATWRNNGQPFTDNARDLARICRVTTRRWQKTMRARIAPFFNLSDGTWRQKRLEKEWQRCARLAEISRSNGAQGGRPQSSKNSELENPAGSTLNHTHKNTPQTPHGGLSRKRRGEGEPTLPVAPEWAARCRSYGKGQRWDPIWGAEPGQRGCGAPPALAAQALAERSRRSLKEAAD